MFLMGGSAAPNEPQSKRACNIVATNLSIFLWQAITKAVARRVQKVCATFGGSGDARAENGFATQKSPVDSANETLYSLSTRPRIQ